MLTNSGLTKTDMFVTFGQLQSNKGEFKMKCFKSMIRVLVIMIISGIAVIACSKDKSAGELPGFEYDRNEPAVIDAYPRLAKGILSHARLSNLPDGTLIRTKTVSVTQSDLDAELEKMVPENHGIFSKNQFVLADQIAAGAILEELARSEMGSNGHDVSSLDQNMILQQWIGQKISGIEVSEEEVSEFYSENKGVIGDAPFEELKEQIGNYLVQQKQNKHIELLVREAGKSVEIAVNSEWAEKQDLIGKDNDVDRARDSGKPTMASFGVESSEPCQEMRPIRESVAKKYQEEINFVHVQADIEQHISARYGIRGVPHIIFFDAEGNMNHEHTGPMTKEEIEDWLKRVAAVEL